MKLMHQWLYVNLIGNCFYTLFPAKTIVGFRQIIFSLLDVRSKVTCRRAGRERLNTGE